MTNPTIGTDRAIEWPRLSEQQIAALQTSANEINKSLEAFGKAAATALGEIGKALAESFPVPQKPTGRAAMTDALLPDHLDLGRLIGRLEDEDPSKVLRAGFRDPHSYRGYYEQVAFELAENITVGEMLAAAKEALGSTYQGWKGGDYTMGEYTETWLVKREGETGESIGAVFLEMLLANTVEVSQ